MRLLKILIFSLRSTVLNQIKLAKIVQIIFDIFLSRITVFFDNIKLYPSRFRLVHDRLFSVTDGARDIVDRVLDVVLDAVYHFALNFHF